MLIEPGITRLELVNVRHGRGHKAVRVSDSDRFRWRLRGQVDDVH
jgi:hypothetical protein